MSETKERSGIFKFFYVLLSIITFPIFAVLFVLRHPLWVLFILVLIAGGAAYWPMSQHNVELSGVVDWYKDKYQSTKLDLAKKAIEEGKSGYVPEALLEEMKKVEEDAKEAAIPKGENYNAKVVRDQKSEDLKASLKKRGGFKKKGEEKAQEEVNEESIEDKEDNAAEQPSQNGETEVLTPQAEGLSSLLPVSKATDGLKEETVKDEPEPVIDLDVSEADVRENTDDEEVDDKANSVIDLDVSEAAEGQNSASLLSADDKQNDLQKQSADDESEMDLF